jgi:hypothetical protein
MSIKKGMVKEIMKIQVISRQLLHSWGFHVKLNLASCNRSGQAQQSSDATHLGQQLISSYKLWLCIGMSCGKAGYLLLIRSWTKEMRAGVNPRGFY